MEETKKVEEKTKKVDTIIFTIYILLGPLIFYIFMTGYLSSKSIKAWCIKGFEYLCCPIYSIRKCFSKGKPSDDGLEAEFEELVLEAEDNLENFSRGNTKKIKESIDNLLKFDTKKNQRLKNKKNSWITRLLLKQKMSKIDSSSQDNEIKNFIKNIRKALRIFNNLKDNDDESYDHNNNFLELDKTIDEMYRKAIKEEIDIDVIQQYMTIYRLYKSYTKKDLGREEEKIDTLFSSIAKSLFGFFGNDELSFSKFEEFFLQEYFPSLTEGETFNESEIYEEAFLVGFKQYILNKFRKDSHMKDRIYNYLWHDFNMYIDCGKDYSDRSKFFCDLFSFPDIAKQFKKLPKKKKKKEAFKKWFQEKGFPYSVAQLEKQENLIPENLILELVANTFGVSITISEIGFNNHEFEYTIGETSNPNISLIRKVRKVVKNDEGVNVISYDVKDDRDVIKSPVLESIELRPGLMLQFFKNYEAIPLNDIGNWFVGTKAKVKNSLETRAKIHNWKVEYKKYKRINNKVDEAHLWIQHKKGETILALTIEMVELLEFLHDVLPQHKYDKVINEIFKHEALEYDYVFNQGLDKNIAHKKALEYADPEFRLLLDNLSRFTRLLFADYDLNKRQEVGNIQQDIDIVSKLLGVKQTFITARLSNLKAKFLKERENKRLIRSWEQGNYVYEERELLDGMILVMKLNNKKELIDIEIIKKPVMDIKVLRSIMPANKFIQILEKLKHGINDYMEYIRQIHKPLSNITSSVEDIKTLLSNYVDTEELSIIQNYDILSERSLQSAA